MQVLFLLLVFLVGSTVRASLVTSSVLQIASCASVNSSRLPCISVNNCSEVEHNEGCFLVLSLPPERDNLSIQEALPDGQLSKIEIWSLSFLSVGIVSLSGVTGAVLWPFIHSPFYDYLMTALVGLAVGSLTSTALFQLIPEALAIKSITGSDEYLQTVSFIWFSIWCIFVIEGFSKIVFKKPVEKPPIKIADLHAEEKLLKEVDSSLGGQDHSVKKPVANKVSAVAWMIIFGDGLHNFIDGMSIGAGYCQSFGTGVGLSVAIACEEFPHELGDFAILLESGMSLKRALFFNFSSACTAFLGLFLGIILGQLEGAHYIFAFAGGLFLYVSLTHLIPELKGKMKERLKRSRTDGLVFFILQNVGLLTGTTIIYLITKYNDEITNSV